MADEENPVEPLISKQESYGSVDDNSRSISPSGLIQKIPTEGYCLVFTKELEYGLGNNKTIPYIISKVRDTLQIGRHPDFQLSEYRSDAWELKLQQAIGIKDEQSEGPYNLLPDFKSAGISYYITSDKIDKYFYVIIRTSREKAEIWADKHKIDMPIEPTKAIRVGRTFDEFLLAHRTKIDGDKRDYFRPTSDDYNDDEDNEDDEQKGLIGEKYDKLDIKYWNNIHLPFNVCVNRDVYYQEHGSVITHRIYLRMLYEMLTDDKPLGGANFIIEKHLKNQYHPLTHFFALRGPIIERPPAGINMHPHEIAKNKSREQEREDSNVCYKCTMKIFDDRMKQCDEIRNYYGESIGFYFNFLVHYTKWLYPMSLLGLIWFIIQMSASKKFGIATPGSTIIVIIAIMWSTFMIENWYRREWKLRFEWGMMRYKETEVPRPTFSGKIKVSPENAELIEDYKSWGAYCCKITCSMSTMVLCVALVIAMVAAMFILKRGQRDNQELTIGIGMLNSIQIFISNKVYTWLAYKLNEWEGHRLQQEYYNNLVIKRIIFIVFNSFYSLFYIAFIDDIYDNDRIRLEAVRTQLITLFLMAIFLQNTMEILFPWLGKKIAQTCAKREEEEYNEDHHPSPNKQQSEKGLLANDAIDNSGQGVLVGVGGSHSLNSIEMTHGSEYDVIKDIEEQIQLAPSPDVLDNTAEIVILQGYIMLFVIIFPLMPFLASVNNYVEFKVDKYNLFHAKRPMPASAAGLGVWKSVLACFNIIAVFSNLGILTFRTPLIHDLLADINISGREWDTDVNLIIFYFCCVLFLLGIIFIIRIAINDQPQSVSEAVARQEACERHLLMANMDRLSKEQVKSQHNHHKDEQKEQQE